MSAEIKYFRVQLHGDDCEYVQNIDLVNDDWRQLPPIVIYRQENAMFKVALDGVVEELIRATIAADPEFASVKPRDLKQKLFLMILENGVAAGFVSHSFDKAHCKDVFTSTPFLTACWSDLVPTPLKASAADEFIHVITGPRSKVLRSPWPSRQARTFIDAFLDPARKEKLS